MITAEERKRILVRAQARKWAAEVRGSNWAHFIPDDIVDKLTDDEAALFLSYLPQFGLFRRGDCRWESR